MYANAFIQSSGAGLYRFVQYPAFQDTFRASSQSSSAGHLVFIDRIGRFRFRTEMCFDVETAGDGWVMLSNPDARLYAVGRTVEDAKDDLEETLGDIMDDYVLCDESELHESGIELRRWFMENVEVISE